MKPKGVYKIYARFISEDSRGRAKRGKMVRGQLNKAIKCSCGKTTGQPILAFDLPYIDKYINGGKVVQMIGHISIKTNTGQIFECVLPQRGCKKIIPHPTAQKRRRRS